MRRFWKTAWTLAGISWAAPLAAVGGEITPVGHWRPGARHSRCPSCQGCQSCQGCPSCGHAAAAPASPSDQPTPMPPGEGPMESPMPMPGAEAQQPAAEVPSFANLAFAEQGMGGGAGTMILGRVDSLNRFNLFDNMGAEPVSRIWFSYLAVEGLDTHIQGNPLIARPNLDGYRFGVEYAFGCLTSFAAQTMYNNYSDTADGIGTLNDDWSNPQFMLKRVILREDFTTVSATLGFEAETSVEGSTINEAYSRWQPGLLAFHEIDDVWFVQGERELSFATEGNATTTADWAVSLGHWLYRHESLDGCRRCNDCLPWVVGLTGQVELLGKHVTGDSTIQGGFFVDDPLLLGPGPGPGTPLVFDYEETRHVVDVTLGTTVLFRNNTALGLGLSFPISGGEVRRTEGIASYNIFF